MSKEKKVLLVIDTVRIVETDPLNVTVERLEKSKNRITKEESDKWVFKGHFSSIVKALTSIVTNEWVIDKNVLSDLESYLKQVLESNAKILKEIENM